MKCILAYCCHKYQKRWCCQIPLNVERQIPLSVEQTEINTMGKSRENISKLECLLVDLVLY